MCGIVAAIAQRNVVPLLVHGLQTLEYRGYDSAGIGIQSTSFEPVKAVGKVSNLADLVKAAQLSATSGLAHTRWATHGVVSRENAHPHLSTNEAFAVVHNGIFSNYGAICMDDCSLVLGYNCRSRCI